MYDAMEEFIRSQRILAIVWRLLIWVEDPMQPLVNLVEEQHPHVLRLLLLKVTCMCHPSLDQRHQLALLVMTSQGPQVTWER